MVINDLAGWKVVSIIIVCVSEQNVLNQKHDSCTSRVAAQVIMAGQVMFVYRHTCCQDGGNMRHSYISLQLTFSMSWFTACLLLIHSNLVLGKKKRIVLECWVYGLFCFHLCCMLLSLLNDKIQSSCGHFGCSIIFVLFQFQKASSLYLRQNVCLCMLYFIL